MKMEILSELPVPSSDQTIIIKRKRTKRHHRPSSPADEDEDMAANCLILLASSANDKFTDMPSRVGIYVYECKTCNRTFPSFQALGGHRASHKRPRLLHEQLMLTPPPNKVGTKIHECSICGSEFGSGQALGGHMRRHRPPTILEKPRNLLALDLDLNLPAPPDVDDGKYNQQPRMVFSAAALVDCHY